MLVLHRDYGSIEPVRGNKETAEACLSANRSRSMLATRVYSMTIKLYSRLESEKRGARPSKQTHLRLRERQNDACYRWFYPWTRGTTTVADTSATPSVFGTPNIPPGTRAASGNNAELTHQPPLGKCAADRRRHGRTEMTREDGDPRINLDS